MFIKKECLHFNFLDKFLGTEIGFKRSSGKLCRPKKCKGYAIFFCNYFGNGKKQKHHFHKRSTKIFRHHVLESDVVRYKRNRSSEDGQFISLNSSIF